MKSENGTSKLNSYQAICLIWITILNQSQRAELVIANMDKLLNRLKIINPNILELTFNEIYEGMTRPTKLHRFPRKMSLYLYNALEKIEIK